MAFHVEFLDIPHTQIKCEEYPWVLRGVLPVPHKTVMDLNNVMLASADINLQTDFISFIQSNI